VAYAVNQSAQVVGFSYRADDQMVATLFADSGIVDLNGMLPDSSGWLVEMATGITEDGVISGIGQLHGASRAFALVPVDLQAGPWGIPVPYAALGIRAYPLPMRGAGRIELQLPRAATGRVALYDVGGRRLAELARGTFTAGRTLLSVPAGVVSQLVPGMYFVRVETNVGSASWRVVVIH
jgi:probable HAF family extracellular repeat protein